MILFGIFIFFSLSLCITRYIPNYCYCKIVYINCGFDCNGQKNSHFRQGSDIVEFVLRGSIIDAQGGCWGGGTPMAGGVGVAKAGCSCGAAVLDFSFVPFLCALSLFLFLSSCLWRNITIVPNK